MKRLLKIIFSIILICILSIIGFFTYMYFAISTDMDNAPVDLYKDDVTLDNELVSLLDGAIDTSIDTDNLMLTLSEDEINKLIFGVIKDNVNSSYRKDDCEKDECLYIYQNKVNSSIPLIGNRNLTVKNAYVEMMDNSLSAFITLNLMGIKTNLKVKFSLNKTDEFYLLKIDRLGLGDLNLTNGIGKFVFKRILKYSKITEDKINEELENKNILLEFDLENLIFSFTKEDLGVMLMNVTKDENNDNQVLIKEFLKLLTDSNNDLIALGFFGNGEKEFGVKLNLENLKYNQETDGIPLFRLDYDDYKSKITTLTNLNIVNNDSFKMISNYLINGYNKLTIEEKDKIKFIDFTSIGIINNSDYNGLLNYQGKTDLEAYITNKLYDALSDLSNNEINLYLDEQIINQVLLETGLVGTGFNLYSKTNGSFSLIYTGIEAIWVDVVDNKIGIKMIYNLNGIRLSLFTNFTNNAMEEDIIEAEFDELRLGQQEFSEDFKTSIMSMISNSLNLTKSGIFKIEDNKIIIDSDEFISNIDNNISLNELINKLTEKDVIVLSLQGSSLDDNGRVSFIMDLDIISVSDEEATLPENVKAPFDSELFVKNKTQTFIISNMSEQNKKIIFTENDFNRMLYSNTSGYEEFESIELLPDNETELVIKINGILFDFDPVNFQIRLLVSINGLNTVITLKGTVSNNNSSEVIILLEDNIKIGKDLIISSDFILDIIEEDMELMNVITYNSDTKSLILSSTSFENMMSVGGTSPLEVEKINIVNGALEVYVSYNDPILDNVINVVTDTLIDIFDENFIDSNIFNASTKEQEEAINDLNNQIEIISTIISTNQEELSSNETDKLVESINNLSEENQQTLFLQIQDQANNNGGLEDLLNLYDSLFTK